MEMFFGEHLVNNLERDFRKGGTVGMLQSLIRILRVSLV